MSKPTIFIRLSGGLGNQLFQFAAGLKVAEDNFLLPSNIVLDTRFLGSYEAKRQFEISFLTSLYPGIQIGQPYSLLPAVASKFRLARIFDRRVGFCEFVSSVEHLKKVDISTNIRSIVLDGYFQNQKILFSEDERDFILENLLRLNHALLSSIRGNSSVVAVHIRRGDFITSKAASRIFRMIPLEYYRAALQKFSKNCIPLIFSDDRDLSSTFVKESGGLDVGKMNLSLQEEFLLMMSCNNFIIGNSTFSWWASYLGRKDDTRIVAPKNWYFDMARNQANQLILPYFELIDV